jgi:hypothetical protein
VLAACPLTAFACAKPLGWTRVSGAGDRKAVYIDECDEQKAKQTWKIATSI